MKLGGWQQCVSVLLDVYTSSHLYKKKKNSKVSHTLDSLC